MSAAQAGPLESLLAESCTTSDTRSPETLSKLPISPQTTTEPSDLIAAKEYGELSMSTISSKTTGYDEPELYALAEPPQLGLPNVSTVPSSKRTAKAP